MSDEEEIDLLRNEIFEFRKGEDTRIVISELMARIDVQADRIAELEAQVAALKKIAEDVARKETADKKRELELLMTALADKKVDAIKNMTEEEIRNKIAQLQG
jgi:N-methylhydantoinase B/oxoprolinase/acetone carboxylase alpha subunit